MHTLNSFLFYDLELFENFHFLKKKIYLSNKKYTYMEMSNTNTTYTTTITTITNGVFKIRE